MTENMIKTFYVCLKISLFFIFVAIAQAARQDDIKSEADILKSNPAAPPSFSSFQAKPRFTDIDIFGETNDVMLVPMGGNLPDPISLKIKQIIEAAKQGQIDALLPLLSKKERFSFSLAHGQKEPLTYWKDFSGDGEGREILAIILDILSSGYAIRNKGTEDELYIWPYLSEIPPQDLTPQQMVELFRILTAGEYQDMLDLGHYSFFKLGIDKHGVWHFFLAGQ